ncbi:MAG: hypothetical protein ACI9UT_002573 [Flavobacteriales bacterium]|jgi:hypothetical protein
MAYAIDYKKHYDRYIFNVLLSLFLFNSFIWSMIKKIGIGWVLTNGTASLCQ